MEEGSPPPSPREPPPEEPKSERREFVRRQPVRGVPRYYVVLAAIVGGGALAIAFGLPAKILGTPRGEAPTGRAALADWITTESAEGGFTVRMPGAPEEREMDLPIPAGTRAGQALVLLHEGVQYTAAYSELLTHTPSPAEVAQFFERLEESFPRMGAVERLEEITLEGSPGRQVRIRAKQGMTIDLRVSLRGNRQFVWGTNRASADVAATEVQAYLDSFRFLPQ